jgi:cytochrome b6-f complex iron-sulfur subunit
MNPHTEASARQKRRDFLGAILTGGVVAFIAAIVYPIIEYLIPPKQPEVEVTSVDAGKLSEIAQDSGRIVKFGSQPVLLIRTANNELRAFSAVCTHLGCTVQYRSDLGVIWCACHNGKYDLNGRNISGPPPRPLDEYRVTVQSGDVIISKNA